MSLEVCGMNAKHKGPFFTLTLIAFQCGPGSRVKGKSRKKVSYVVGRLCRRCIRQSQVRVKGEKLFPKRKRKSDGIPPVNSLPAVAIAKNGTGHGIPRNTGGIPQS